MPKKRDACGGAVGKGGVNPAPTADNATVRVAAEQLELVPIDDLVPYANNAKIHDKRQIAQLRASLREFGFVTPVLIDFDNNIIAGHGRVEAARAEGMTEVPCVLVSNLTEAQRKAYILADNRLSETSAWDTEALKIELEGLEALQFDTGLIGFDAEAVKEIEVSGYTRAAPGQGESSSVEDAAAWEDAFDGEPPETTAINHGDLYQMGRHRLLVGSTADESDMIRLMNGVLADMVFTDPPYNIASKSKNFAADCSESMKVLSESDWDNGFDLEPALAVLQKHIAENASCYVCASHFTAPIIWAWMEGWADYFSYCVWAKPNPMPSLSKRHWTWNTELICYATRGKHVFNFPNEGHALSTWTINKLTEKYVHPTQKPIAVPATAISHSSNPGDIVLDGFGGSGSTLIACEQLGRTCYTMEIDPKYAQVIIDRWEKLTGLKAEKIN